MPNRPDWAGFFLHQTGHGDAGNAHMTEEPKTEEAKAAAESDTANSPSFTGTVRGRRKAGRKKKKKE